MLVKKHRAWDIEIQLKNTDSTDFGEAIIPIRELDATEEKSSNILAKGPRMIIMKESIDTDPERNEESSLSLVYLNNPQDILISIELENISSVPLNDVQVTRTMPKSFVHAEDAEYVIEDEMLVWNIGRLNPGEKRPLSLSFLQIYLVLTKYLLVFLQQHILQMLQFLDRNLRR